MVARTLSEPGETPGFTRPIATVDVVPLRLGQGGSGQGVVEEGGSGEGGSRGGGLEVGTIVRLAEPFAGRAALPGGFVHVDEDDDVEATARRVLAEKAGAAPSHLEQLAVFSGPDRDARGWSLSVAFVALYPRPAEGAAEEAQILFAPAHEVGGLPFDHDAIVATAIERVRVKAGYSSLPLRLIGETFTVPEAHSVYETLLGAPLDRAAFRRKLLESGFVEETGAMRPPSTAAPRPTRLYRLADEGLAYVPRNFRA